MGLPTYRVFVWVLSSIWLIAFPWTVARLAALAMEFFRQQYWSRLPFPPPGGLPNPGMEPASPASPALQADSLQLSHQGKPTSMVAKSLQSCLTLCDPIDGSPPGSPWDSPGKNTGVGCHFLLQCMKVKSLSPVQPSATPWTAAFQAPPSMGFSRQEYWSGVPLPSLTGSLS